MLFFRTQTALKLSGEKVSLRSLRKEEIPQVLQWLSNPEMTELAFGISSNHPQAQNLLNFYRKEMGRKQNSFFAVHLQNGLFIGFCRYTLRPGENAARIGIVIGERDQWGKGYGKDAVMTLLRYLFREKNIGRVELDTNFSNVRARRCFEACGFHTIEPAALLSGEGNSDCFYEISREKFSKLPESTAMAAGSRQAQ